MSFDRPHKLLPVRLSDLVVDPDYQCRVAGEDADWVARLTDLDIEAAKTSDYGLTDKSPVVVFATKLGMILVDGFQRTKARQEAGGTKVMARVYMGTPREALLYTLTEANRDSSLPLSNADVKHRVRELLLDRQWRGWSDPTLAQMAGVSRQTVAKARHDLIVAGEIPAEAERPEDLPDDQAQKWDEIVDAGGSPTAYERNGKKLVRDKGTAKKTEPAEEPETVPLPEPVPPPSPNLTMFTDAFANRIPNVLRDIFVGQDSLSGRMVAESKSIGAMPIPDWIEANPWLAAKTLQVVFVDHQKKKHTETWGVDRIRLWLASILSNDAPKAVCRACDGRACPVCQDKGWLPGWLYETYDWEAGDDAAVVESSGGDDSADEPRRVG
jgi:hypothetical protein